MMRNIEISLQASNDLDGIANYGLLNFDKPFVKNYNALIAVAISDLANIPYPVGVRPVANNSHGILSYPLRSSNKKAGGHIKTPAHWIYFFIDKNGTLVIASIAHPSRQQHISGLTP